MSIVYNADEIYQIGVQIEKNGEAFYTAAAASTKDADIAKLFGELASWEGKHVKLFTQLSDQLLPAIKTDDAEDYDQQKFSYLKAIADSHVFLSNTDIKKVIDKCTDVQSVLKTALSFEKDSVVLYAAMKSFVTPELGKDTIDALLNEEIRHVVILQQKLATME